MNIHLQTSFETYDYDQNGNLLNVEKYLYLTDDQPVLMSSTEYFYDKQNNAYLSFSALMIPGEHTNKNNVVKEVYTLYSLTDGSVEDTQTKEYSYNYNVKEFPEQRSDGIEYTYY